MNHSRADGHHRVRQLWTWIIVILLAGTTGCNGCKPDGNEKLTREELEKKRREEQEALLASELISLPADSQRAVVTMKPGHWHETNQRFKSNREDLQVLMVGDVYYGNDKANLPSTNFVNEYARAVSLPKGQQKSIEMQIYVPPTTKPKVDQAFDPNTMVMTSSALKVGTELRLMPLMTPVPNSDRRPVANELKPYTSQLAVLSPQPLAYQYLSNLDAVRWGVAETDFDVDRILSYDVALVGVKDNQYAFPHSMLTMTSMSVLIWDDVSVEDLTEDQRTAIVDWVHWGGQLIINGPTSWSRLQNSFLSPYLPANTADSTTLATSDFAPLSKYWQTIDVSRGAAARPIELPSAGTSGLRFHLNDRGQWLPGSGELVAENVIGRGRVVVTGFSLRDPSVHDWPYFSSFLSTGLLRRPPREIRFERESASQRQLWAPPYTNRETEPQLHSNFRILTRDLLAGQDTGSLSDNQSTPSDGAVKETNAPSIDKVVSNERLGWGGTGGWSDHSGTAVEAISALRAAAGIELPSRSTILKLLGGYLICLVPLNWLVFKLMRRLEYAWIAAPIMAIVGVVIVGKVARLDIGFARRTTEISVLEMQPDYARAHLTQYVALYTSLSTNYTVEFPEQDSVALPMGDVQREMRRAQMGMRQLQTNYGRADGVVLEPLTVYSNSTEMLHSEQLVDVGMPIQLVTGNDGTDSIVNSSAFPIYGAIVVRRNGAGNLESAWLDTLQPNEQRLVDWRATKGSQTFAPWSEKLSTQRVAPTESELSEMEGIWVGGVLHQIGMATPLVRGQTRLFGYTDQPLGGLKITPGQDQYDQVCVVVAHLSPAKLPKVVPDFSIASRGLDADVQPNNRRGNDASPPADNP